MSFDEAAGGQKKVDPPAVQLVKFFEHKADELAAVVPNVPHMRGDVKASVQRIQQTVVDLYKRPGSLIAGCTPDSVFVAARDSVASGLDCTMPQLKQAWLVPYNRNVGSRDNPKWVKEASFQIGYVGYTILAERSQRISHMVADVVYEDELDSFECDPVLGILKHPRKLGQKINRDPAKVVGAYCAVWLIHPRNQGETPVVADRPVTFLMDRDQIEARRMRNPAEKKGKRSPWKTDYAAMARKCPIRALYSGGSIPLSTSAAIAVGHDIESSGEFGPTEAHDPESTAGNVMGVEIGEPADPDGPEDEQMPDHEERLQKVIQDEVDEANDGPVTGHTDEDWNE